MHIARQIIFHVCALPWFVSEEVWRFVKTKSHILHLNKHQKESFLFLLLTIDGMCSFIIDSREKISLDKKSLQIQAKSCDFILNPGLKSFSFICVGLVS